MYTKLILLILLSLYGTELFADCKYGSSNSSKPWLENDRAIKCSHYTFPYSSTGYFVSNSLEACDKLVNDSKIKLEDWASKYCLGGEKNASFEFEKPSESFNWQDGLKYQETVGENCTYHTPIKRRLKRQSRSLLTVGSVFCRSGLIISSDEQKQNQKNCEENTFIVSSEKLKSLAPLTTSNLESFFESSNSTLMTFKLHTDNRSACLEALKERRASYLKFLDTLKEVEKSEQTESLIAGKEYFLDVPNQCRLMYAHNNTLPKNIDDYCLCTDKCHYGNERLIEQKTGSSNAAPQDAVTPNIVR